jgi:ParB family transcriptional regulator, chromosome partitioning protein
VTERKLGRGLDFLIKRPAASAEDEAAVPTESTEKVAPASIVPNPFQPRRVFGIDELNDLIESIRIHGILQPIAVRRKAGGFELISGERRWRASQELGLESIPVVIHEADDQRMLELALIENIQREDLNAIEKAKAYRQLIREFNLTQEEAAQRLSVKRSTVANHLRLLDLESEIQDMVSAGQISMGHARALAGASKPADRRRLAQRAHEQGLSVRDVEKLVKAALTTTESASPKPSLHPALEELRDRLRSAAQTPVEIRGNARRGKVVLSFSNAAELDRILALIEGGAQATTFKSEQASE